MPNLTIPAIVLRFVNYRDNDRMLTLLSPSLGRVDVLSRGCRRPRSPLLTASEWFATGEFVLFQNKDKYVLNACTVHDSFYPIRLDYDKLNYGAFLANLCEIAAHPNEPCEALFTMLVRALNYITYREVNLSPLATAFMLLYMEQLGYKPRLKHCVTCKKPVSGEASLFFDAEEGGIVCQGCKGIGAVPISRREVDWLEQVHLSGFEAFETLPDADAPLRLMLDYVIKKVDRPIKSAHLISP